MRLFLNIAGTVVVILGLIGAVYLVNAASVMPPNLARMLALGSRGDDVRALQEYLTSDPALYPEGFVTGYFGQLTKRAVERFQSRHGIETVGIVGPKTRAKLRELRGAGAISPTPTPIFSPSPLPSGTPSPTATPESSPTPTPTAAPTPTPTPDPLSLIKTGTGLAPVNQVIKIGETELWYVAQDASKGRGYLAPPPSGNAAMIANISPTSGVSGCENINAKGFSGPKNICSFTDPNSYSFTIHPEAIRFYDTGASSSGISCYQGIMLFKYNGIYGGIEPIDVDSLNQLSYRYWYDESGGTNFGLLCPASQ